MKGTKEQQKPSARLSAFREYLFSRSLKVADVILVGVMAALLLVCWLTAMPLSEVFSAKVDINLGYSAKQDAQGLYYVVDDGHSRLLCFGDDAKLRYALEDPTDGSGDVLYIDDFALDGGLTYLSASKSDGMMLSKEVIAVFNGKRYVRTIAERDYSGMLVNKHRFYGITVQDGALFYAECEDSAIVLHRVALDSGEEQTERAYFDNAFDSVGDCTFHNGAAYILAKNGTITVIEDGKRATCYSTRWTGEENRVPYRIAVRNDGAVCFTDIRAGKALLSDVEGRTSTELCEHTASQTVNFTTDGNGALYLETDGLRVDRGEDSKAFQSLTKSTGRLVGQGLWFAALIALILIGLIVFVRAGLSLLTRKYGVPQQISFWVLAAVAGVSLLLTGMLMSNLSSTYRERLLDQMESDAYIVAKRIPTGTISQIRRAEDFDGDEYQALCEVMDGTFLMNLDMNRQLYCTIQRLDDDMEQGFAVASLDQSNGMYYPMDDVETEEVRTVYRTGEAVWNEGISNISGTYVSVKVPVMEKGEVCGVVSVGSATSVIESIITRLQIQIIMSIVVILLLIWLITSASRSGPSSSAA